ncbi:DGQHR domain-containing protein [Neobacillus sp. PS3-34]|uniref:DGQHR domain-containing protein n=1 Tax=Neobacillus sp. PS3-34 TaxID=3070678 RepID=UPI0027E05706|nr:DGQHR domain-containing protein [Neobacillus sp. PS3-34]WML48494.1 DGQHR domain-containing protein [Neobacillus sp. PS3-34]
MYKIPYIRIKQRSETFFVSKINVSEISHRIDFHFRDPYSENENVNDVFTYNKYVEELKKQGIHVSRSEDGIQRRLQLNRIKDIENYLISDESNFFPSSILLSIDVSDLDSFDEEYVKYEESEMGYFSLPENVRFTIIDGQHRLAGLLSAERVVKEFELPAVILFNVSRSTAAKLFSDINGKQKPVNRSLVYDLYSEIDTFKPEELKMYNQICQKFYSDPKSPLYKQIKMLGIGEGAISQAFFIDYCITSIKYTDLNDIQDIYSQLFYYFKAFQYVFPEDWPVKEDFLDNEDLMEYSRYVLKVRNSQLVKTNGFGAIMQLFPKVYKFTSGGFQDYLNIIEKLRGQITWVAEPGSPTGTGKAFQKRIKKNLEEILGL